MNVSFKNRIAFHYMIATALIMAFVFGVIFIIVKSEVYRKLDNDLSFEANKHKNEIGISGHNIEFINKAEWEEQEHKEIQVNPVFIQLVDKDWNITDKSPNLKNDILPFDKNGVNDHFNATLNKRSIREIQIAIKEDGLIKGYIQAAISSESSETVIRKLRNVLILSYLFVLGGLYFFSRFVAGRSIIPIKNITQTVNRITRNNLNERVILPSNKDELYHLSTSFNDLMDRIERALEREREFTSDASHELRTPLAILRGTLEVLIRHPRSQSEYEEKVNFSLKEIDRMTATIEHLFLLARLDNNAANNVSEMISLATLIDETLMRYKSSISENGISVDLKINTQNEVNVPLFYSNLIIDNIISNAIKYSKKGSTLKISIDDSGEKIQCRIQDQGIGIRKEDIDKIYNNFFRSEALTHKFIPGNGLGLSIAKKAANAIHATISVSSILGKGSTFSIQF